MATYYCPFSSDKTLLDLPCPSQLQYGSPTCNFWPRVSPCAHALGGPWPPGRAPRPAPCSPSLLRMRRQGPAPGIRGLASRGRGTAEGHRLGTMEILVTFMRTQIVSEYVG